MSNAEPMEEGFKDKPATRARQPPDIQRRLQGLGVRGPDGGRVQDLPFYHRQDVGLQQVLRHDIGAAVSKGDGAFGAHGAKGHQPFEGAAGDPLRAVRKGASWFTL